MTDNVNVCPRFKFQFFGQCPNTNCLLWYKGEESESNCHQIQHNVQTGLDLVQARNNKVLMQLSLSDDPKVLLETSTQLLQLGLVYAYRISNYERSDDQLCRCGSKQQNCSRNSPACKSRQQWLGWIVEYLFHPLQEINNRLRPSEYRHEMLHALLTVHKMSGLPALLQQQWSNLAITRRLI